MFDKKTESCRISLITPILLGIIIVLNVIGLYLLTGNSFSFPSSISVDPIGIKRAMLDIEYDKVGGRANYEVMTRAQQLSMNDPQNPSNISAMKQYVDSFASGQVKPTNQEATDAITRLPSSEVAAILSGAVIEGNKNADILVIEYSDMECPFCVKQYHDTKLQESLKAQYGDAVGFVFKNNRGVNHNGTESKALAILCAKQIGGETAYSKFYHGIMDGTTQASVYPVSKLPDIAKKIGLDVAKWQVCMDKKSTLSEFQRESSEAQKYKLNGTPGTLIVNVKTGKYATIEGAYPFTSFTDKIASLR